MEESRKITLGLGNVSLSPELGPYYIDMRPANIHYKSNIYGGRFDENGVPMITYNGQLLYFPVNVMQYGFIIHAEWLTSRDEKLLDVLNNCVGVLINLMTENNGMCIWWHQSYNQKYKIKPPWASAMAQGEIISLFLRVFQITHDKRLLAIAKKAYQFLKVPFKEKGVRRIDDKGYLWFEEYPSEPPSYVLNGFIYSLLGLFDLYRVTDDKEVKADIEACIHTLKDNLHRYDASYWSYYDLLKKELVRYYYQKNVHVPQMKVLHKLTGETVFMDYAVKWEKQLNFMNFVFVRIMYRIRPRIQKLKNLWVRKK